MLEAARDGWLYDAPPFDVLPSADRVIRDIAFSGDGEPTTFPRFEDALRIAADARHRFHLDDTKLVLITDAAYLHRGSVQEALRVLDHNNGEIWAKLDAGTEEYYKQINRPNVPFQAILDNILEAARVRPIVIQTLVMRVNGQPPSASEIQAYCARLSSILEGGGKLKAIQLYTIARKPSDPRVVPLTDSELDQIAATVRAAVSAPAEVYYGVPQVSEPTRARLERAG